MELEKLAGLLKENKVDFVIIGAAAFPVYGYVRATLDVDIFIRPTRENAGKCYRALMQFGYDLKGVTEKDFLNKKILIRQYRLEIDVHPFVKGVAFDEIWKHKKRAKTGRSYVYFAALEDLIKMKTAAGRGKDKDDLRYLRKILKEQNKHK